MMEQSWHDLLFAHWAVPAERLRPLLPEALELDTREETAWLAVTPFRRIPRAEREPLLEEASRLLAFVAPGAEHDVRVARPEA